MAALTQPARVLVRAAAAGEGDAVAGLWRELWDAHEVWGGYAGSRDARVYAQLAKRLDDDARARAGHPILGRHVHLVAEVGGAICGQVEGWFERHGIDAATPHTCEVRSLIVTEHARGLGAGRALLDTLARTARKLSRGTSSVLAAEVLDRNPARDFYARVGYVPVSWSMQIDADVGAGPSPARFAARLATPADAFSIARLEATLAARRRERGDARFDRPRPIEASWVAAIAAHLACGVSGANEVLASLREPATMVAVDAFGSVRGVASFTVHALEPPFVPARRALVGRFALDEACPAMPVLVPLLGLGCKLALTRGAHLIELTDLSPPGTELYEAALAAGARAWSRVVTSAA